MTTTGGTSYQKMTSLHQVMTTAAWFRHQAPVEMPAARTAVCCRPFLVVHLSSNPPRSCTATFCCGEYGN